MVTPEECLEVGDGELVRLLVEWLKWDVVRTWWKGCLGAWSRIGWCLFFVPMCSILLGTR